MGSQLDIPFNGPTYQSSSDFMMNQICRNFYLQPWPEPSGEKYALFGTPGLKEWVDLGVSGEVRGMVTVGGFLYLVVKDKFVKVTQSKTVLEMGTLGTEEGLVGMASNGLDVVVVDGRAGYVYDIEARTFDEITDPDFRTSNDVVFVDGYYLVSPRDTGQIWRSDYNDGSSWGGLAFSSAGSLPDDVVALSTLNRDIFALGSGSTEVFVNTGAATFNFEPIGAVFNEIGAVGPFARAKGNNALFWVGKDKTGYGQVYLSIDRQPRAISTSAIARTIQSWGDLSDVQMMTYEQAGHVFCSVTSPSANQTLVYDSSTGMWHERSSRVSGADGRWRANVTTFFDNKNLTGDFQNGKVYEIDPETYDEDGEELISVRRTAIMRSRQQRITVNEVQIVNEPGVGVSAGEDQDVDPKMIFRFSRDGGRTWIAGDSLPMGQIGEVENVASTYQLGQGKNWVFEITISARVKRVILEALAEVERDD